MKNYLINVLRFDFICIWLLFLSTVCNMQSASDDIYLLNKILKPILNESYWHDHPIRTGNLQTAENSMSLETINQLHQGLSALHVAILTENRSMFEKLLNHGADINQRTKGGKWGCSNYHEESSLELILRTGNTPMLTSLLQQKNLLIDAFDVKYQTALCLAARLAVFSKNYEQMNILLQAGADINGPKKSHRPIEIAIIFKDVALLNFFIQRKARIVKSKDDSVSLIHAAHRSLGEVGQILRILQKAGACIDELEQGCTSLYWKVTDWQLHHPYTSHFAIRSVLQLIHLGANPYVRVNGKAVLDYAPPKHQRTLRNAFIRKIIGPKFQDPSALIVSFL